MFKVKLWDGRIEYFESLDNAGTWAIFQIQLEINGRTPDQEISAVISIEEETDTVKSKT